MSSSVLEPLQLDPRSAVTSLESRRWLLVLLPVIYALVVFPFVYRGVVGEPDIERMAVAILYGARTGLHELAGFHYGLGFSFGYYAAFYHLLPRSVLLNPAALMAIINFMGFAFAVLSVGLLGLYCARLFGIRTALLICILFGFSPIFLELGTSGHPIVPSQALLLLGAWLLTFVTDPAGRTARRVVLAVVAFVAITVALTVRADAAFVFPFITVMGSDREMSSLRSWMRASALRLAVLASALLVFLLLSSQVMSGVHDSGDGLISYLEGSYRLASVPKSLIFLVLITGVATTLLAVGLMLLPAARRQPRAQLLAIAALVIPTALFWLPVQGVPRHLLPITLAAAIFVALGLSRNLRPRAALYVALLVVLANQILPELAYPLVARYYPWSNPHLTGRRISDGLPFGAFPMDQRAKQQTYVGFRDEGRAFADTCSGKVLALAEESEFILMYLIGQDPSVRLSA